MRGTEPGNQRIAGVVLAAGLSSRMGRNKMLIDLGSEPVVRRAVRSAVESGLDPVLVVVGPEADGVREAFADLPATVLVNPAPARGLHTSVRVAFDALAPMEGVTAAVLALADMPLVSSAMLRAVTQRWRASPSAPLAISLYGDVIAPPILYARALFSELSALGGETAGKQLVQRHRGEAIELSWPQAALMDLDEPGDVARATALLEKGP